MLYCKYNSQQWRDGITYSDENCLLVLDDLTPKSVPTLYPVPSILNCYYLPSSNWKINFSKLLCCVLNLICLLCIASWISDSRNLLVIFFLINLFIHFCIPISGPSLFSSQSHPYQSLPQLSPLLPWWEGEAPLWVPSPPVTSSPSKTNLLLRPNQAVQVGEGYPMAGNKVRDSPHFDC